MSAELLNEALSWLDAGAAAASFHIKCVEKFHTLRRKPGGTDRVYLLILIKTCIYIFGTRLAVISTVAAAAANILEILQFRLLKYTRAYRG